MRRDYWLDQYSFWSTSRGTFDKYNSAPIAYTIEGVSFNWIMTFSMLWGVTINWNIYSDWIQRVLGKAWRLPSQLKSTSRAQIWGCCWKDPKISISLRRVIYLPSGQRNDLFTEFDHKKVGLMAGPGSGHWWGQDASGHSSSPNRTDSRHDHKSHYRAITLIRQG